MGLPSLGTFTDSYCDIIEENLSLAITELTMIKSAVRGPIDSVLALLDAYQSQAASLSDDINDGINTMNDAVSGALPGNLGSDEYANAAQKCKLLGDSSSESPTSLITNLVSGISKSVGNALNNVIQTLSTLPEYPIALALDEIDTLLKKLKIADLLDTVDKGLECMDALCGRDVSGQITTIDGLIDDLFVTDSGSLDRSKMYTLKSLQSDQISNVEKCYTEIQKSKTAAADSITSSVSSYAGMLGGGI